MLKINPQAILDKEMDRKEFLIYLGVGVLALTGVTTLLRDVVGNNTASKISANSSYGTSSYGGPQLPSIH